MDSAPTNQVQEHSNNEPIGASETPGTKASSKEHKREGLEKQRDKEEQRVENRKMTERDGGHECRWAILFWRLEQQTTNMPTSRQQEESRSVTRRQRQWQSEESGCLSSLRDSSHTGSVNLVVLDSTLYGLCLLCPLVFLALRGRIDAQVPVYQGKEVTKTFDLWPSDSSHSVFHF